MNTKLLLKVLKLVRKLHEADSTGDADEIMMEIFDATTKAELDELIKAAKLLEQ